jgi:hypothetical protein
VDRDRLERRIDVVDQLDPAFDHGGGALRLDRLDIGAVDHGQAQIGAAMPHREGRGLDQTGQSVEGGGKPADLVAQRGRLPFAVGRVGEPEQDGARLERRRRRRSAHFEHARRAEGADRHREAPAGRRSAFGQLRERRAFLGRKAASAPAQIGHTGRRAIEPKQSGETAVGLQPAAAAEQGRDGDMGAEQGRRALGVADPRRRPPGEADAPHRRPQCDRQPPAADERDERRGGGGQRQHRCVLGAKPGHGEAEAAASAAVSSGNGPA